MTIRTREPELDAEQEVDLGRYAGAVAARWWLPLAGLVAGAVIGYLISLGGSQVWKASATVYLGQPYSYPGNTPLQAQLRGKISTQSISGGTASVGTTRLQQSPLVRITVQAPTARKARIAANSLARQITENLSGCAAEK